MAFLLTATLIGLVLLPVAAVVLPLLLILWLVFAVLRVVLRLVVGAVVLPFLFIGLVVGAVVAGLGLVFAVLLPLVPVALAVFIVWMAVRLLGQPARRSAIVPRSTV